LCDVVVVKSGTKERIAANLQALLCGCEEAMTENMTEKSIAQYDAHKHYCWNPIIVNPPQPAAAVI